MCRTLLNTSDVSVREVQLMDTKMGADIPTCREVDHLDNYNKKNRNLTLILMIKIK